MLPKVPKKPPKRGPKALLSTLESPISGKSGTLPKHQYLLWFQHIRASDSGVISIPESQKNHPGTCTAILLPQTMEKSPKLPQRESQQGPQIHPKSIKIQVWTPRCPMEWPQYPLYHENDAPGYQNGTPGCQNRASRPPK